MKILYHHRTASKDGQAVHISELIKAFRELGHDVLVVGPHETKDVSFGYHHPAAQFVKRFLPKAAYEIAEVIYAYVAYAKLKKAFFRFKPDVVYERHALYTIAGARIRSQHLVPFFVEMNSPIYLERARHGGVIFGKLATAMEGFTLRQADYVLPVSNVLADMLHHIVVPKRIEVVRNGVSDDFIRSYDKAEGKRLLGVGEKTVIGFSGFVREWHGLDKVVDFLSMMKREDVYFVVIGDGPARSDIERHARERGVAHQVMFTGVIDHSVIAKYVAAFDTALQPAVTPYASPLKLFEYMALGIPIVAPAVQNIMEVLIDDYNALLFEENDFHQFTSCVTRLLNDQNLKERIGQQARATILQKSLTWKNNAKLLQDLFLSEKKRLTKE